MWAAPPPNYEPRLLLNLLLWDLPLSRVLALKSGVDLRTLHAAAEAFLRAFGNVHHDEVVEHAVELLMTAAKSGAKADLDAATDQVALVLKLRRVR